MAKKIGFGYDASATTQRFVVSHPKASAIIIEHCLNEERRLVARMNWNAWVEIKQPVRAEFNRVLLSEGAKLGDWTGHETTVRHTFGKELLLLVWALEGAPIERIPRVLDNWRGLAPEQRWWLCEKSTEHAHDQGWRMAIKYALGAK